ncbi:MAG: hypothetical protein PHY92_01475 [Alphaproteobacteria bacterium]|nr:hypothetical protein [Alphaproteobacteria bacterium]
MVDPVSTAAISSMLRAQTTGASAGIVALKSNQQAQQAIISQLQQGLDQNKSASNQPPVQTLMPSNAPLPRGSLVDVYA